MNMYNRIFTTTSEQDLDQIDDCTLKPVVGSPVLARIRTFADLCDAQTLLTRPGQRAAAKRKIDSISIIMMRGRMR